MISNELKTRYYSYRIKLEILKYKTMQLIVIARILLILAIVVYRW